MRRSIVIPAALAMSLGCCLCAALAQDGPAIPGLDDVRPLSEQARPGTMRPRAATDRVAPARPMIRDRVERSRGTDASDTGALPDPFAEPAERRNGAPSRPGLTGRGSAAPERAQPVAPSRAADPRLRQAPQRPPQATAAQPGSQSPQYDPRYRRGQQAVPSVRTGNPATANPATANPATTNPQRQSLQRAPVDPRRDPRYNPNATPGNQRGVSRDPRQTIPNRTQLQRGQTSAAQSSRPAWNAPPPQQTRQPYPARTGQPATMRRPMR